LLVCVSYLIDCVNLGFINSRWHYKIILKEKLDGIIRGDNLTIGNKLHILSEFYENQEYQSIDMIVENCDTNNIIENENNNSLDSIGLISYKNPCDSKNNNLMSSRKNNNNNKNVSEKKKKIIIIGI